MPFGRRRSGTISVPHSSQASGRDRGLKPKKLQRTSPHSGQRTASMTTGSYPDRPLQQTQLAQGPGREGPRSPLRCGDGQPSRSRMPSNPARNMPTSISLASESEMSRERNRPVQVIAEPSPSASTVRVESKSSSGNGFSSRRSSSSLPRDRTPRRDRARPPPPCGRPSARSGDARGPSAGRRRAGAAGDAREPRRAHTSRGPPGAGRAVSALPAPLRITASSAGSGGPPAVTCRASRRSPGTPPSPPRGGCW